jgi:pimeloyl-ACP methyl ester carboxylesterase
MLSYIFAARYPTLVKKLILVSSGVLEAEDTEQINKTRLSRLSNEQKDKLESVRNKYVDSSSEAKNQAFMELFTLVQQADAYDLLPHESDLEVVRPRLYESVWKDMVTLRDSGDLVRFGSKITCPVVAIHGNYDPRSGQAIKESLSSHVKDFRFILLDKCGHYPWYEKQAKDRFYTELRKLLRE